MELRFYIDPESGDPHIYEHQVSEREAEDVLSRPIKDRAGHDGARLAIGQTPAGRYLLVVYVPDPEPESLFVITAFDLGPKALRASSADVRRNHEQIEATQELGSVSRQRSTEALRDSVR